MRWTQGISAGHKKRKYRDYEILEDMFDGELSSASMCK
jgi:hypothetical protein